MSGPGRLSGTRVTPEGVALQEVSEQVGISPKQARTVGLGVSSRLGIRKGPSSSRRVD